MTKAAAAAELAPAIRVVAQGNSYLSPEIARLLIKDVVPQSTHEPPSAHCLGPRGKEVPSMIADGHRSSAIARRRKISASTVEAHRRNIVRKLGLHTIAELTKYALREELTSL